VAKIKVVFYIGSNGFPFGMAAVQRQLQIAKAVNSDSTHVYVINRKGVHSKYIIQHEKIKSSGIFEGIQYRYASLTPLYPDYFLIRNFLKIVGIFGEFCYILYFRIFKNLKAFIVNSISLLDLKYYYFISRILRIRLVYDYVEFMSSLADRNIKQITKKETFDYQFHNYADALIIISQFLEEHVKNINPFIPYIIVPPIMDFKKFENINFQINENNYFLFCGSIHYIDVIEFILQSYMESKALSMGVGLIMVINGSQSKFERLQSQYKEIPLIKFLTGLGYETLISYYKSAKALLIPLQNNLQDQARFPFKISEYTAARRPIVTSDSGAIIHYFKDGENALIANTGDLSSFSSKLNFIIDNPELVEQIGKRGYETGLNYFNYKSYNSTLKKILFNSIEY
jgi:glycosyltransferase involved in cell wall biosynthesis